MFTSPAVLAIVVAHFCNNWGFYTLLTCLPTFLKETLCLDIAEVSSYAGDIIMVYSYFITTHRMDYILPYLTLA